MQEPWVAGVLTWGFPGPWCCFLLSAACSAAQSWLLAEINTRRGIKQRRTTHADVGDVQEACWWKRYCCLQCVFNSYLPSFLMKPRFYHQHEVEWIFICHASTELSARSNYAVLWEAARAQLDFSDSRSEVSVGQTFKKITGSWGSLDHVALKLGLNLSHELCPVRSNSNSMSACLTINHFLD